MIINQVLKRVLGDENNGMSVPSGPALVYFYRRFGFTVHGSDSSKEVCRYVLDTAVDGLFVSFYFGGVNCYIHGSITRELSELYDQQERAHYKAVKSATGQEPEWNQSEIGRQCEAAVESVLVDLLRPVRVRDVYINVLGKVDEFGEYDEENGRFVNEAERSFMAGYGVVTEVYKDFDLYLDFVEAVRGRGEGDLLAGMRALLRGFNRGEA